MKKRFMDLLKKMIVLCLTLVTGFYSIFNVIAQLSDEFEMTPQETTESSSDEVQQTLETPEPTEMPLGTEETTDPVEWTAEETTESTEEIIAPTELTTEPTEEITTEPQETTEPETIIEERGKISGFIWVDGDGSLETDWDGIYNGEEQPLADYSVYLYNADDAADLSAPIGTAKTNAEGIYEFAELEPGSYIVGLASEVIDDQEYLLPMAVTEESKFAVDWENDSPMGFTEIITLEDGETVYSIDGINAGMRVHIRIPMGTGIISGFIWVDGDGSLETDWDGIYNGDEQPLADYPVYLYAAADLSASIGTAKTNAEGVYEFTELGAGDYIVGLASEIIGDQEYILPMTVTDESKFAVDLESDPLMAFAEAITLEDGESVYSIDGINAGMRMSMEMIAMDAGAYEIMVNNTANLKKGGIGWTSTESGYGYIVTFNSNANGNNYIFKTTNNYNYLESVEFASGANPASITFISTSTESTQAFSIDDAGLLKIPADYYGDLIFNNAEISGTLTLPVNYKGNVSFIDTRTSKDIVMPSGFTGKLGITRLITPILDLRNLSLNYTPLIFNGLETTTTTNSGIRYPNGYNQPITIGGDFKVKKGYQFPPDYKGHITIGNAGGIFKKHHFINVSGTETSIHNDIFIPAGARQSLTYKDATTSTSDSSVNLKLTDSDKNFKLYIDGDSSIFGYIEVPEDANITIDSAVSPNTGSSEGILNIKYNDPNSAVIGGSDGDSGHIIINGGTLSAINTYQKSEDSYAAVIGGAENGSGRVTINGGTVYAEILCFYARGAAIGGGVQGKGIVTINDGNITARSGLYDEYGDTSRQSSGAAIGGGRGSNTTNPKTGDGYVNIYGGTIYAEAFSGAAIGGGEEGAGYIVIEPRNGKSIDIYVESSGGAGIGNGAINPTTDSPEQKTAYERGDIVINGGKIVGRGLNGARIGAGRNCAYKPLYTIDASADLLLYNRDGYNDYATIDCIGKNRGNGYFVSFFTASTIGIGTDAKEQVLQGNVYVLDAETNEIFKILEITPGDLYRAVGFSTGNTFPQNFKIYVRYAEYSDKSRGLWKIVHFYDHLPPPPSELQLKIDIIPSITNLTKLPKDINENYPHGYPHSFDTTFNNSLHVYVDDGSRTDVKPPDEYMIVTEKHVLLDGTNVPGSKDTISLIAKGSVYTKEMPVIGDYSPVGYKWDYYQNGEKYTLGLIATSEPGKIEKDSVVYYIYKDGKEVPLPPPTDLDAGSLEIVVFALIFVALIASGFVVLRIVRKKMIGKAKTI